MPLRRSRKRPAQLKQLTTLTHSWTAPPPNFQPTSVTFVGADNGTGGVIGAVIGQAGPPCASQDCTSLASTSDYGQTWKGVSAPYAPGPTGAAGVSQLRFANLSDGWAYGPALYETSHGGSPWQPENTDGLHVIDVEAVSTRALRRIRHLRGHRPELRRELHALFAVDLGCRQQDLDTQSKSRPRTSTWLSIPGIVGSPVRTAAGHLRRNNRLTC